MGKIKKRKISKVSNKLVVIVLILFMAVFAFLLASADYEHKQRVKNLHQKSKSVILNEK